MPRLVAATAMVALTAAFGACGGGGGDPVEEMTSCLEAKDLSVSRDTTSSNDDAPGFVAELEVDGGGSSGEVVIFESEDDAAAFIDDEKDSASAFLQPDDRPVLEQRGAIAVTGLLVVGLGQYTAEDRAFFDQLNSCAEDAG